MTRYVDWREAEADAVQPLYAAECGRWRATLDWDYSPSCALLEEARCRRRLPGLLALDRRGSVVRWTYFLVHDHRLQVGALVAADDRVAHGLLARVLASPEARSARGASCFLYPALPSIGTALARGGFTVLGHTYLRRRLDLPNQRPTTVATDRRSTNDQRLPTPDQRLPTNDERPRPTTNDQQPTTVVPWSPSRLSDAARLFASAYAGMPESHCFAPADRLEEWLSYVGTLTQTSACGRFCPALSAVAQTRSHELAGLIIVTAVSERTAHVAQVAVGREHRGQRLGEGMVELACERARQAGYGQITLLVADSNTIARHLYDRLGFEVVAPFVFAYRDAPIASRRSVRPWQPWRRRKIQYAEST